MSFVKQVRQLSPNNRAKNKKPFYKRKGWKVSFLILGTFLIFLASFLAYLYSNGSKVFEDGGYSSLARAIKGERLEGEEEGRVNVLFLGRGGENHPGGLLTDSMLVASIDTKEKKIALISIPRDLLVPIKNHGQDKLNSTFAYGYKDFLDKNCKKKKQADCTNDALAAGSALTEDTVSNVLGIPIQYYVMIDFEGFKQLVNKLGGVDIYVDKAIYDPLYPDKNMKGYELFSIKAGQQHMNGEVALKYSRSRETTSDFDRSRRQQQVISAVKDKSFQAGVLANPKKVLDLVTIVGNHMRTNFEPFELKLMADIIKNSDTGNIISRVLSSANDSFLVSDSSTGTFYLRPKSGNFDDIKEMVKNIFSGQHQEPTSAKIEVLNASKTPGLAGKVALELEKNTKFEVSSIKTYKDKLKKTVVFDYTNGKKKSATDFLKNKYKVEVLTKTRDASSDVDIALIIGDDFSVNSLNSSEISKR